MSVLAGGTIVSSLYSVKVSSWSVTNILFELAINTIVLMAGDSLSAGASLSVVSHLAVVVATVVASSSTITAAVSSAPIWAKCGRCIH